MSGIQFERRKKKKSYLIPLVVIILLYFMIPVFLISKGSDLINKSLSNIESEEIFSPSVEFYNGISFLTTAAAFPGFAKWAENIVESSVNQMNDKQEKQFNKLCKGFVRDDISLPVGFQINYNKAVNPMILNFKSSFGDSIPIYSISMNDSLLGIIDSAFCTPWIKFYEKTKRDKSQLHSFCKSIN